MTTGSASSEAKLDKGHGHSILRMRRRAGLAVVDYDQISNNTEARYIGCTEAVRRLIEAPVTINTVALFVERLLSL